MSNSTENEVITTQPQIQGRIDTGSSIIHWDYNEYSPITLHGHLPFFTQFLHAGTLFSDWVDECPLGYKSNNAPSVRDVLGTAMLSVLSGHSRYCHSGALYGDSVAAELLGIRKMVSHDSLLRAVKKMDEKRAEEWLHNHLLRKIEPLLQQDYVLDIDGTVKTVFGSQEGAEVGYNPHKPGRPSYCYHTYMVGTIRLVLDVDVLPGNQTAGCYSHPGLWRIFDYLPRHLWPTFVRGDIAYGNEGTMGGCEERDANYLFRLRQSKKVKELCKSLLGAGISWRDAGSGWQGYETTLKLSGWSVERRVVVLRRPKKVDTATAEPLRLGEQNEFEFVEESDGLQYDWSVLVTNLTYDLRALGQLYRDRGDCENVFDELKNQWGWGGFTTQAMGPTKIMAGIIALVYNWWNIFCRLADPGEHMEAITSRPLLQNVVGCLARSGGKKLIHLSAQGRDAPKIGQIFKQISEFITTVLTATQLNPAQKWVCVLNQAYKKYFMGHQLFPTSDGSQLLLI